MGSLFRLYVYDSVVRQSLSCCSPQAQRQEKKDKNNKRTKIKKKERNSILKINLNES